MCLCASVCLSVYASSPILLTIFCSSHMHTAFRTYEAQCPSAEEVREVVITHLKEKEILENSLPSSIVIGPFHINVDSVKQSLSKKRKALATSMLDILAKNLHKEVDSVSNCRPGPSSPNSTPAALRAWWTPTSKMLSAKSGVSSGAWVKERTWKSPCLDPFPHSCFHMSAASYLHPRLLEAPRKDSLSWTVPRSQGYASAETPSVFLGPEETEGGTHWGNLPLGKHGRV